MAGLERLEVQLKSLSYSGLSEKKQEQDKNQT